MTTGGREEPRIVGRYAIHAPIGKGGMATVHLGRLLGPVGFTKVVAIKRLHEGLAKEPEFVEMFVDEARVAGRLSHPNIVPTLDVVATPDELFLVMDYVEGETLAALARRAPCQPRIAVAVVSGILRGLHHAHEAKDGRGLPLELVHRDVSPQNVLVGCDGVARLLDFGIAKAMGRSQQTRDGHLKGKLAYMAPEILEGRGADRRSDVYAAGVVLWENLTHRRLFAGEPDQAMFASILTQPIPRVSQIDPRLERYDSVVARALERDPGARYQTANEMLLALEQCGPCATTTEVERWVRRAAADVLATRATLVLDLERSEARPPDTGSPLSLARVRRRHGAAALFALFVIALGAVAFVHTRRAGPRSGPPAEAPPPPSVMPPAAVETVAAEVTSAAPAEPAADVVPATPVRAKHPGAARDAKDTKTTKSACEPPYVLDAAGRRHYKIDCVRE